MNNKEFKCWLDEDNEKVINFVNENGRSHYTSPFLSYVLSFSFGCGMMFVQNKHKSGDMSRISKDVALYYDDVGIVQSREQWIQQIQFDLLTGFWKDHLDFIAPDGVRCTASRMFEQQLSTKLLRFYGVVAVEDYNEDEAFFGRRIR